MAADIGMAVEMRRSAKRAADISTKWKLLTFTVNQKQQSAAEGGRK
jgi:hypothetical protein